jgi:hypothetical protein
MRASNDRKALQNRAAIVSTGERAASPANARTACSTAIRRTGPIDFSEYLACGMTLAF